jgi:ABC-2 type transport system permease protein
MKTLIKKELREGLRTWRIVVLLAILAVSGLASPILAYYLPEMMKLIPDVPEALMNAIPPATVADAVAQFVKNVSQFGILMIVILTAGLMAAEKERGTAAMLFVRPVRRANVVLAKWLVWAGTGVVGLLVATLFALAYTAVLFELLPVGPFLALGGLLLLSFLPYLSLALLASSLMRTQGAAYGVAFGGFFLLLLVGSLPRIGEFAPAQLPNWGAALTLGQPLTAWPALAITVGITAAALIIACLRVEREEL